MINPEEAGSVVAMDDIMFQMLVDAVEEVRHLRDSPTIYRDGQINPDSLRERVPPWRRGQIVNSAGFIRELYLQGKWSIPRGALDISNQILSAEDAYLDDLQAASLAGIPWQGTFEARLEACIRCGGAASWHFVLKVPPNIPVEAAWRLARPENAVPICHRCTHITNLERREDIRSDLAWGLWATRFEALHRWYLAVQYG